MDYYISKYIYSCVNAVRYTLHCYEFWTHKRRNDLERSMKVIVNDTVRFSVDKALLQVVGVANERLVHVLLHPTTDQVVDRV